MDIFIRNFVSKYLRIIKKHSSESLIKLLSALEYTEAILEITAEKLFGYRFKWFVIFLTNLVKCVTRLQLLIVHKFGIQSLPSMFSLKNFLNPGSDTKTKDKVVPRNVMKNATFQLNHSGRIIRTIKNSPVNVEDRDWIVPTQSQISEKYSISDSDQADLEVHFDVTQDKQRYISEVLHIMRPLCHLSSMLVFGSNSWKQFMVPLVIDSLSLLLMNGTKNLSSSQKKEMKRRSILFLHYFIRSPFYDKYSSSIIAILLSQIEQRIAGTKFIIKPLKGYIPQWRAVYNYCWTS